MNVNKGHINFKYLCLFFAVVFMAALLPVILKVHADENSIKGSGTQDDPYEIYNAEELEWFRDKVNGGEGSICGKLMDNIVLNNGKFSLDNEGNVFYNSININDLSADEMPKKWTPIGNQNSYSFKGVFDGNGKIVKGIYINEASSNDYGLFGIMTDSGTIKNVGIENSYIKVHCNAAGVCGRNMGGTISCCYNQGIIAGWGFIGGIVGYNRGDYGTAKVINCYNIGQIIGTGQTVGGVAGYSAYADTVITRSYNAGKLSCTNGVGGVLGYNHSGAELNYCYYLNDTALEGCYTNNNGKITDIYALELDKLTGDDLNSKIYLQDDVWLFKKNEISKEDKKDINVIVSDNYYFPQLKIFGNDSNKCIVNNIREQMKTMVEDGKTFYLIYNAEQLKQFKDKVNGDEPDANGKLMADIDLNPDFLFDGNGYSGDGIPEQWEPMGSETQKFTGIFNGNGKTVSGIYIDNSSNDIGLFGNIGSEGIVKTTGIENSYICGNHDIGSLAGRNEGTIINCYNASNIKGSGNVGGLCGTNIGTVIDCYNTGTASADNYVAGISGINEGIVSNCYNAGIINGVSQVGNIAGTNNNILDNCFYFKYSDEIEELCDGKIAIPLYMEEITGVVAKEKMKGLDFQNKWSVKDNDIKDDEVICYLPKIKEFKSNPSMEACMLIFPKEEERIGYSLIATEGIFVKKGGSLSFNININNGFKKTDDFSVRADGSNISETNGMYIVKNIMKNQVISIKGIQEYIALKGREYTVSELNQNGWTNKDFKITAGTGYLLSYTLEGPWKKELVTEKETADGLVKFYVKNGNNEVTKEAGESYKIDRTLPTGTVFIGKNSWKSFLNYISFGLFFKEDQTVSVTPDNDLSGIVKLEFAFSDRELKKSDVESLDGSRWVDVDLEKPFLNVTAEDTKKFIYYIRLTDMADNENYISTNGAEFDMTAPIITGVSSGETYCSSVDIMVNDDNLESVLLDGIMLGTENGRYNIEADNGKHTVMAVDKADNKTMVTITVNRAHTYDDWKMKNSPSCTEKGSEMHMCRFCSYMEERDIEPAGHKWEKDFTVDLAATCTMDGRKSIHCANCTHVKDITIIKAEGHKGGMADCKNRAVCQVCGNSYGDISPDNHIGGTNLYNQKSASCTEQGYTGDKVCVNCGKVLEYGKILDKTPHTYHNGKCIYCGAELPSESKTSEEETTSDKGESTEDSSTSDKEESTEDNSTSDKEETSEDSSTSDKEESTEDNSTSDKEESTEDSSTSDEEESTEDNSTSDEEESTEDSSTSGEEESTEDRSTSGVEESTEDRSTSGVEESTEVSSTSDREQTSSDEQGFIEENTTSEDETITKVINSTDDDNYTYKVNEPTTISLAEDRNNNAAQTGDSADMVVWLFVILISSMGFFAIEKVFYKG